MGEGQETRVDALTGEVVVLVGHRQGRPNLPAGACPFCPGGVEAPEPYDVRWFVNRWPPLPDGRAEVILFSPEHEANLGGLEVDKVTRIFSVWAERTTALGARPDVDYVLAFENRGPEVGATISHPHGQIYGLSGVPPVVARELGAGSCQICAEHPTDRAVAENAGWRAWVPYASAWPFGMLLAPLDHLPDLPTARPTFRDAAMLLTDCLSRLDRLFAGPMPYMLWWHQRPTDGNTWPTAHLHAHVAPLYRAPSTPRFVAAGELGSGVYFNPVAPDAAAALLREA
ncbi:MAG TPA: DUF4931 domain-containing protein [Acidimicrobiales bacterium]|nr:DUF4931 domain-containing protein [Acidimicrobiales bacterium]